MKVTNNCNDDGNDVELTIKVTIRAMLIGFVNDKLSIKYSHQGQDTKTQTHPKRLRTPTRFYTNKILQWLIRYVK